MEFSEMVEALKPVINSIPIANLPDDFYRRQEKIVEECRKELREETDRRILGILNESFGMNVQDTSCLSLAMLADVWEQELLNNPNPPSIEDEIRSIKKQLKHCKNPMQSKQLNQKLNALYKEKKKQKKENK